MRKEERDGERERERLVNKAVCVLQTVLMHGKGSRAWAGARGVCLYKKGKKEGDEFRS